MAGTRVNASVTSENPEIITRAIEAFSRAAAGLALEQAEVYIIISPDDEDDDE